MFTSHGSRKHLTRLEHEAMEFVWNHPDCTADSCREGLSRRRPLKDATVRTILRRLEDKAYVTHTVQGRTFLYRATDTQRNVAAGLVAQLVDRFCGGSMEELLVGLVDNQVLKPAQLRRMAKKIAERKEKRS
jgi:predicted transcriptional regulator